MSPNLIHLPVRYCLEYWPPLQDLPQSSFLPLAFGHLAFQCPNSLHKAHWFFFRFLKPDLALISPDRLFPSYWNFCFLPPMPLLLCFPKKTVGPVSFLHNSQVQQTLTVIKGLSSIKKSKSKGLILFPRKRVQKNYRLILFTSLYIHFN